MVREKDRNLWDVSSSSVLSKLMYVIHGSPWLNSSAKLLSDQLYQVNCFDLENLLT